MRIPRPAVLAAGPLLVAATVAGGSAAPVAATAGPAATVLIHPGVIQAIPHLAQSAPPTTGYCERHYHVACFVPSQVQEAYNLPALYQKGVTGKGQTIVIVDSYGSPTIGRDLKVFDSTAGLPAPPALRVIQPAGPVPPYRPNSNREGWAGETTLDVEYAHTIAPDASILLVETPTSENEGTTGFPQIVTAEKYVIGHHLGGVISQSFSATEQTFPSAQSLLRLRGAYTDAASHHVTVLAASGDSGVADVKFNGSTYYLHRVTSWPDSDPLVTGVGGTQLHLSSSGAGFAAPTAWNDTYNVATNLFITGNKGPNPLSGGGGTSVIFARPSWQNGVKNVVGARRGVPDISMSAACNGGVDVYSSFPGVPAGWGVSCGTSEATPEFAGIVALAEQVAGHSLGLINPALYQLQAEHAAGLTDVTAGNNTVSFTQNGTLYRVKGFQAVAGYDLATGVGTVNAPLFVPELAHAAG